MCFGLGDPRDDADERVIGRVTTAPYHVTWDTTTVPDGPVTLYARAYDLLNHRSYASIIRVNVDNTHPLPPVAHDAGPSVVILAPRSGQAVSRGIPILIQAFAWAESGLHSVSFRYSGPSSGAIAADAARFSPSPCSAVWETDSISEGTYKLTAVACDNCGHSSEASAQITILERAYDDELLENSRVD